MEQREGKEGRGKGAGGTHRLQFQPTCPETLERRPPRQGGPTALTEPTTATGHSSRHRAAAGPATPATTVGTPAHPVPRLRPRSGIWRHFGVAWGDCGFCKGGFGRTTIGGRRNASHRVCTSQLKQLRSQHNTLAQAAEEKTEGKTEGGWVGRGALGKEKEEKEKLREPLGQQYTSLRPTGG